MGNELYWQNLGADAWPGVSVVSGAPNTLDLFIVDKKTNLVFRNSRTSSGWGAWEPLKAPPGTNLVAAANSPAAISRGPDLVDVFVVQLTGEVWRKQLLGATWTDWQSLGIPGPATAQIPGAQSRPAVCNFLIKKHVALFVRDGEGDVHGKFLLGTKTGAAWQHLGPLDQGVKAIADPVAVWRGIFLLHVFVLGDNQHLYHKEFRWGGWFPKGAWEQLAGIFSVNDIAAVSWGADRIDVFGIGHTETSVGSALMHQHWSNSQWSGLEELWGPGVTQLRAASWGPNRIDLVARGGGLSGPEEEPVYHRSFSGGIWSPGPDAEWENITGDFYIGSPAEIVSWGPDRLDVFIAGEPAIDRDANVWTRWWTGTEWQPHP